MGNDNCWWLRSSISCNRAKGHMAFFLLILFCAMTAGQESWQRPGCYLVGYTRPIKIPNCVEFDHPSNACIGFCDSWASPTKPKDLAQNPRQVITSVSNCCDMDETEEIPVWVQCVNGTTRIPFRSAKSCKCLQCKKDFK